MVSEIGFGAWAIGGPAQLGRATIGWGQVDDEISLRALETALDLGVNFFDTADVYGHGHSEELIGRAFKGKRDRVILASKVGNLVDQNGDWIKDFSPDYVRRAIEASLKRLGTDYIDLYQLHSPHADFRYSPSTFQVFDDLVREGKIRCYGVSIGPVEHGLQLAGIGKSDAFQLVYSMLSREAEEELLPLTIEHDIGIIARVPLASGFLTGKFKKGHQFPRDDHRSTWQRERIDSTVEKVERLRFLEIPGERNLAQAALQYCLAHPAVSCCIPGAKTAEQVRMNVRASDLPHLTPETLERIRSVLGGETE